MCGRTRCTLTDADIVASVLGPQQQQQQQQQQQGTPPPRLIWPGRAAYSPLHNCGPARVTPAVTAVTDGGDGAGDGGAPTITVESMVWGVPRGGGGSGAGGSPPSSSSILVNGRAETAFSTPTWARALSAGPSGRAVVIANGYYEWKRGRVGASVPHYVHRADGVPLALAALVVPAPPPPSGDGPPTGQHHHHHHSPPLRRYAVLTTSPPKSLAWLHDRAPLLLPTPDAVAAWLGPAVPRPPALAALAGAPAVEAWPALAAHPVKLEVGSVRYQAPDCSADVRKRKGSLGSLFSKAAAAAAEAGGGSPAKRVKKEDEQAAAVPQQHPPPPPSTKKKAAEKAKTLDGFVVKK